MKENNLEIQQSKKAVAEEKVMIDNNKWEISIPNELTLELSEDTYFVL